MTEDKFPKMINYDALKQQFGEHDEQSDPDHQKENFKQKYNRFQRPAHHSFRSRQTDQNNESSDESNPTVQLPGLTGTRLRSYAFAVLTRKEYSKKDLIEKLSLYAENKDEVLDLVEELARENYQSDQRVAEMLVRSQIRQGKGPNRIKLALNAKHINKDLAKNDIDEIDWYEQAYALKIKKFGPEIATDPKIKAKQIRFLQYRGFEMDAIMKAIKRKENED